MFPYYLLNLLTSICLSQDNIFFPFVHSLITKKLCTRKIGASKITWNYLHSAQLPPCGYFNWQEFRLIACNWPATASVKQYNELLPHENCQQILQLRKSGMLLI